ncbi:uncharacterized protein G2W53_044630 [Senna tora]|uniref:Uncharacterized protein n=1 Tax=Senna tora TaxID=362788 RepID=A0A834SCM6_9FABA|nr:uncharacterized protein G2W53_044630 [Senna tora]
MHMLGQNEAYDTRKPPKKFQGNMTCARPNLRWTTTWITVGRRPPKINHPWAKSPVHMLGQNEAFDTRKSPKKFQRNPTCAQPNLRWTTTWIAVGSRPPKINHPWVNFFSWQNLTCIWGVKMILMTQGSLPRCFKAIRVGRPAVDHVDRRPSKITESWVNFFVRQNLTCIW